MLPALCRSVNAALPDMLLQLLSQLHRQPLTRSTAACSFAASTRLSRCGVLQQQAPAQATLSTRSKHSSGGSSCLTHGARAAIQSQHSMFSFRCIHSEPDDAAIDSAHQDMAVGDSSTKQQAGSSKPDSANPGIGPPGHAHSTGRPQKLRVDRWQPKPQPASAQPQSSASGSGRAAFAFTRLNQAIMAAQTAEQLLLTVQQPVRLINYINVTAAFSRAAKVCTRQGNMVQGAAVQQLLRLLPELAQRVHKQLGPRELANIMHACGALQLPGVVTGLLPALLQPGMLHRVNTRHLSNTLHGMAKSKAQVFDSQLQQLLAAFTAQLAAANPQDISNLLWAIADMGQQLSQEQLQPTLQRCVEVLPSAKPQEVSNVIWAVASMGQQLSWGQLQPMLQRFMQLLQQHTKPQNISNTMWGVASMGQQMSSEVLQPMLKRLVQLLPHAKPQEASIAIWAVASMGQQMSSEELQPMLKRLVQLLAHAKPQAISNAIWAVATMGQQLPADQLQAMLQRLVQLLPRANPQDISNTLWAVGSMGQQLPAEQLQTMLQWFVQLLPFASPQPVVNILWAVAEMGHIPLQLLAELAKHPQLVQKAHSMDLSGLAYAFGRMGYSIGQLPGDVLLQAKLQLGEETVGTQALATLCWSAAVLDLQPNTPQVLKLAAAAASTPHLLQSCTDAGLRQLYQVHLWLLDTQCAAGLSGVMTAQQLQQCQDKWQLQVEHDAQVGKASALHTDVLQALLRLPSSTWQQPPVMEQRTADGNFSIDIAAVRADGVRLAIEVDGPTHFLQPITLLDGQTPCGPVLNGPTKSRNRAYAARGYVVVSVPYFEWDALTTRQLKQKYMLDKIKAAC